MHWIAPTEKDTANETLEKRLWDAADQFRANSGLKAGEYSSPVLGLSSPKAATCLNLRNNAQRQMRFLGLIEWQTAGFRNTII